MYTYRLSSAGADSTNLSVQSNFVWRLSWVWARVFALHVTIVPWLASKAAVSRQRVATLRCDVDESAPRCGDVRELEVRLLIIHAHTSSSSRAEGRSEHFVFVYLRLHPEHPTETHTLVVGGVNVET